MTRPLPRASSLPAEWRPLAALTDIVAPWRDLAGRALEPNAFYEPSFALAVAPVLGADARAVLVWSTTAPRKLLGFFPSQVQRWRYGFGPAVLRSWVHPFGPLGTPLVDRDHADAVLASWLEFLARDETVPALLLMPLVPQQGAFAEALERALAGSGAKCEHFGGHRRALLVPGAERAQYLDQAINHKVRKELDRKRRRLADLGPVEHTVVDDPKAIGASLDDFISLERHGWKGRVGTAIASDPKIRAFVERAIPSLAAEGKARMDRLTIGGQLTAATIILRTGSTVWGWKTAYDESFHRYSPGVQIMLELTRALLDDPTVARIDSTAAPDHPMIDHLWRERLALSDRLILLRPAAAQRFALACRLEASRRFAIRIARAIRDRLRRHRIKAPSEFKPAHATTGE